MVGANVAKAVKAMTLDRRICLIFMMFFLSKDDEGRAVSMTQVDNGAPQSPDDSTEFEWSLRHIRIVNYFTGCVARVYGMPDGRGRIASVKGQPTAAATNSLIVQRNPAKHITVIRTALSPI